MTRAPPGITQSDPEPPGLQVLVIEDERLYAQAIARGLRKQDPGIQCTLAHSGAEALRRADQGTFTVILLDHRLPDDDGIRLIPLLLARQPGAALIMMTAFETIPNAIRAIRQGAEDYLVKQTSVRPIVERVLEIQRRQALRAQVPDWPAPTGNRLLGETPEMDRVRQSLGKVARSADTTVLVTGETGTGKEVTARTLHHLTSARHRPFVTLDCLALPPNLMESILFGHVRGAFTSATEDRPGAVAEAADGTLLLDEIGELPLALQGKLLRVLETRTYQRVGSVRERPVRARIVAATHRDLAEQVADGAFRHDLYQRLSVFPIHLPPLRERPADVPLLARHFLDTLCERLGRHPCSLPPEVETVLTGYGYPGNVRELRNIIERAVVLAEGAPLTPAHLPERVLSAPTADSPSTPGDAAPGGAVAMDFIPGVDTLESVERKMIREALQQAGGVKSEAARLLGISRYQLLRRLEKHGLRERGRE